MRQTPSTSSFAPSTTSHHSPSPADTAAHALASAAIFRSLVFAGSVPIEVVIAPGDLPPAADRGVEAYYVRPTSSSPLPGAALTPLSHARSCRRRASPTCRSSSLRFASTSSTSSSTIIRRRACAPTTCGSRPTTCRSSGASALPVSLSLSAQDMWQRLISTFCLRRHWPIGLLYDYHHVAHQPSLLPPRPRAPSFPTSPHDPSTLPNSLASVFAPLSSPSAADLSFPSSALGDSSSHATLRAPSSAAAPRPRTPSSARSATFLDGGAAAGAAAGAPWRVTLHLRDPPSEQLLVSNRVEDARAGFMAMVKVRSSSSFVSRRRSSGGRRRPRADAVRLLEPAFDTFRDSTVRS